MLPAPVACAPGPARATRRCGKARVCYDHLAGKASVAMHKAFVSQGLVVATMDGLGLSAAGRSRFAAEGLDVEALDRRRRTVCRTCLD